MISSRFHVPFFPGLAALIFFLAVAASVFATPPAGYYLVWSDEFNGTSLDTTKWDYWLLGNRRDAVNVANAVSLNGSNLVITTYTSNNVHYTAMIATDGSFWSRYGYWEASMKFGGTNGMWSAFWMQATRMSSGTLVYDPWTSGSEIDIEEHRFVDGSANNINNYVQNNIHWNGYGSSAQSAGSGNVTTGAANLGTGFHTFGFLWTPTDYTLYVDGNNLRNWNYNNNSVPVSRAAEWTILSCEVDDTSTTWAGLIPSGGYGDLANSTTRLTVDYVRYYAPTNMIFWSGAGSSDLTSSANYVSNMPPLAASDVIFSQLSATNLSPTVAGSLSLHSLVFLQINNAVTVGGANTLTLGGGIDLSAANHTVNINCPVNLGANQTWTVGINSPGNTLNANGPISGSATLSKGGWGTLILNATNSFSGTLNADTGSTGSGSNELSDGFLRLTRNENVSNIATIAIRNNNAAWSTLQLTNLLGNLTIPASITLAGRNTNAIAIQNMAGSNTLAGNFALTVGGANYWLDSDSGTLNLAGTVPTSTPGGTRTLTFMGAGNILISGTLQNGTGGGTVSVVKTNAGTLTINNAGTYSGATTLSQGILQANASGVFGTGAITADSGTNTAHIVLGNGVNITNALTANTVNPGAALGLISVADNSSASWSGPLTFNANATAGGHFAGPATSGLLTISGAVALGTTNQLLVRLGNVRFSGGGSYGEIQVRANTTSLGANNGLAANAVLDLAGNGSTTAPTSLDLNGFDQTLAGLKNAVASANAAWITNSGVATNTLTLSLGATNYSFGGSIVGQVALTLNSGVQTLTRSGTTALNGLYTYTGDTTITGGTLVLGSGVTLPNTHTINIARGATLDASASGLTLATTQTLSGSGALNGNFVINGALIPGPGIGVITFSNTLTLGATSTIWMEIDRGHNTNDQVICRSTLNVAGTLLVTNLSGTLAAGDSFKLFQAVAWNGSFSTLSLPPLNPGLAWSVNSLPGDGTLRVVSTTPATISNEISSNLLTLSWPSSYVGWRLQTQTNSSAVGLSTNWVDVPGSASTNQVTFPLDLATGAAFYRIAYP